MTRTEAFKHIKYIADDAGSFRKPNNLPCDKIQPNAILIGWNTPNGIFFVASQSYLYETTLAIEDATEMAIDGLNETNISFFKTSIPKPDYIISSLTNKSTPDKEKR